MIRRIIFIVMGIFMVTILASTGAKIYAQTATDAPKTIIQRLAEKFGLKENDVQTVFTDFRNEKYQQMRSQRQARIEENLKNAVSAGKITEAQKQAILNKLDELQKKREQERAELESWAKANGIAFGNLMMGHRGFKFGHGMMYW